MHTNMQQEQQEDDEERYDRRRYHPSEDHDHVHRMDFSYDDESSRFDSLIDERADELGLSKGDVYVYHQDGQSIKTGFTQDSSFQSREQLQQQRPQGDPRLFWCIMTTICSIILGLTVLIWYSWFEVESETVASTTAVRGVDKGTFESDGASDILDTSALGTSNRPISINRGDIETLDFPPRPFVLRATSGAKQCFTYDHNLGSLYLKECDYGQNQRFKYGRTLQITVRKDSYDQARTLCLAADAGKNVGLGGCNNANQQLAFDPQQHFELDTLEQVFLYSPKHQAKNCLLASGGGAIRVGSCDSSFSRVTVEEVPQEYLPRKVTLRVAPPNGFDKSLLESSSSPQGRDGQEGASSTLQAIAETFFGAPTKEGGEEEKAAAEATTPPPTEPEPAYLCLTMDTFDPSLERITVEPCMDISGDQTFLYWPVWGRLEIKTNTGEHRCLKGSRGFTGAGTLSLDSCALEGTNQAKRQGWTIHEEEEGGEEVAISMVMHGEESCATIDPIDLQAEMWPCRGNETDASSMFRLSTQPDIDPRDTIAPYGDEPLIFYNGTGQIRSGNKCLQRSQRYVTAVMAHCDYRRWDQMFFFDPEERRIHSSQSDSLCMDVVTPSGHAWKEDGDASETIAFVPCDEVQKGEWNPPDKHGKMRLQNLPVLCITYENEPYNLFDWKYQQDGDHMRLYMEVCTDDYQDRNRNERQIFAFPVSFWGRDAPAVSPDNPQNHWELENGEKGALIPLHGSGKDNGQHQCITYGGAALTMQDCQDPLEGANQLFTYESGKLRTSNGECMQGRTDVFLGECNSQTFWRQDSDARLWLQVGQKKCLEYVSSDSKFAMVECDSSNAQQFLFQKALPPIAEPSFPLAGDDVILDVNLCSTHLITSDSNRDHQLSQDEYFGFVKSIYGEMNDPLTWSRDFGNYSKLPVAVQETFGTFQQGGLMPVGQPNQAEVFEGDALVRVQAICYHTSHSIQDATQGLRMMTDTPEPTADSNVSLTPAPTSAPTLEATETLEETILTEAPEAATPVPSAAVTVNDEEVPED